MSEALNDLSNAGVSIWLDDLSRERLDSGNLADLVATSRVVGVTTNPTIFAGALADGERYRDQVAELAAASSGVDEAIEALTSTDVQRACDVLADVHVASRGVDGRVSIEVPPSLARDTDGTVEAARRLHQGIDRPNLLVKIPATHEGLPAIAAATAAGISINVTLIFSLERYRDVMDAYLYGLEQAQAEGRDLSTIQSVASFFVSRVDSAVDALLPSDSELRGKAAIANACLAYEAHLEVFSGARAQALIDAGANMQRPLWASTGVKDPAYPDTLYVSELVVPGSVNTMPEATLNAFADHGRVTGDTVTGQADAARMTFDALATAGIDLDMILENLEVEGLSKFDVSWAELMETVQDQLARA